METFLDLSAEGSPTYFSVGSLEIATTEARWTDLHRKMGYATSWGLEARLLDPRETGELLPWLDTRLIRGSIHIARDGIVRAVPTVERIAARASALGVEFQGGVSLTGVRSENGRIVAAETREGEIRCERLVLCGGIWGPLLGQVIGSPVPIQPCAHPYVRSKPLPQLEGLGRGRTPGVATPGPFDVPLAGWQPVRGRNYCHEPHLVSAQPYRGQTTPCLNSLSR